MNKSELIAKMRIAHANTKFKPPVGPGTRTRYSYGSEEEFKEFHKFMKITLRRNYMWRFWRKLKALTERK